MLKRTLPLIKKLSLQLHLEFRPRLSHIIRMFVIQVLRLQYLRKSLIIKFQKNLLISLYYHIIKAL
ncbi:hypothetical protein X777_00711 [Ooceraea biroi]|uniref:ENT domain-containing protein n=1 Tax=Ooceraea biroi TaxID=2015173 RepID=A0A026VVQ6_OOCBI|nr:hypothetical protein X777_00711 [Ooceraea biroi]